MRYGYRYRGELLVLFGAEHRGDRDARRDRDADANGSSATGEERLERIGLGAHALRRRATGRRMCGDARVGREGATDEKQAPLRQLRAAVCAGAPDAVETIAYAMPALRVDGRFLVSYAEGLRHDNRRIPRLTSSLRPR